MSDKRELSTNAMMKLALARPLDGPKQITPLVLPKVHPDTEIAFRLWEARMRKGAK